jgi:hypothetical protein
MNRVPLYGRLPEIYRIRDAEQEPAGQLQAYLSAVETVFDAVHENIEALYDDLFIETCDPWVIPYIGDLLGVSHLSGDPRTLRADVADTIALRRRKGSLGAIERLASNLTGWPARAVEMRPNLAWATHLNHQRPDAGGAPPWGGDAPQPPMPRRGGTVSIRDSATLSLIGTPFDPFAYTPDVRPLEEGIKRINLPNVMVSLWRLQAYRLGITVPLVKGVENLGAPPAGSDRARYSLRIDLDPLDRPVRLFNIWQRPEAHPTTGTAPLTTPDAVSAPILRARLDEAAGASNAWAYLAVDSFTRGAAVPQGLDLADVGLQLYLPDTFPPGANWRIRGANLCAWETGLDGALLIHDIVIDPMIGRMVIGLASAAERDALASPAPALTPRFFAGYTYGAPGPFGAHPVSRDHTTPPGTTLRVVNGLDPNAPTLQAALNDLAVRGTPLIVEIRDSLVHDLDPATLPGMIIERGIASAQLTQPLTIRAGTGHRPVIRLASPFAFRPVRPGAASVSALNLRLEGLFITGGSLRATLPLIARAAVARLELDGVTLDPGGHRQRDGALAPRRTGMQLASDYGFDDEVDAKAFEPRPDIVITRSITGALLIDDGYELNLQDSLVDGGGAQGKAERVAIGPATANLGYAACLSFRGTTVVGTTHTREARGQGGIFCQRLDVWNHQAGCIKLSAFVSDSNRLPPNYGCLTGAGIHLAFTSLAHGDPGYGQLAAGVDKRLTNRGPGDEAMGATNFLMEAHARANLALRLGEYLPVGTRATLLFET